MLKCCGYREARSCWVWFSVWTVLCGVCTFSSFAWVPCHSQIYCKHSGLFLKKLFSIATNEYQWMPISLPTLWSDVLYSLFHSFLQHSWILHTKDTNNELYSGQLWLTFLFVWAVLNLKSLSQDAEWTSFFSLELWSDSWKKEGCLEKEGETMRGRNERFQNPLWALPSIFVCVCVCALHFLHNNAFLR